MTNHNEWLILVKSKAVLIKLTAEASSCEDCNTALLDYVDQMWLEAGREITEEMVKYQNLWIEGYLQAEPTNLNTAPSVRLKKSLN